MGGGAPPAGAFMSPLPHRLAVGAVAASQPWHAAVQRGVWASGGGGGLPLSTPTDPSCKRWRAMGPISESPKPPSRVGHFARVVIGGLAVQRGKSAHLARGGGGMTVCWQRPPVLVCQVPPSRVTHRGLQPRPPLPPLPPCWDTENRRQGGGLALPSPLRSGRTAAAACQRIIRM